MWVSFFSSTMPKLYPVYPSQSQDPDIIRPVSLQIAAQHVEGYQVSTDVYEGPLDLLLNLIERAELDITTLALAQVTDQYLAHLQALEKRSPDEVSAFLVIAARLLQIKSSVLLPKTTPAQQPSDEEDPGEALARQLIQYRRFKQLASWLAEREERGLRTYLRIAPPSAKVSARLDMSGWTLENLVATAREVLGYKNELTDLSKIVTLPRITIRERIHTILQVLKRQKTTSFRTMLLSRSRIEVVITFLAMLELIKRRLIEAQQSILFGDIQLQPTGELDEKEIDTSEFGE